MFIIFAFREQSLYVSCAVAVVLFIFFAAVLFISFRIRASYLAGIAEDELEVMVYDANHYLYRNTGHCSGIEDGIENVDETTRKIVAF